MENKSSVNPIYSRIDRVLGHVDWLQNNPTVQVEVLEPGVSDHALLKVQVYESERRMKKQFKFLNCTTEDASFMKVVSDTWNQVFDGRPQFILWKKLP